MARRPLFNKAREGERAMEMVRISSKKNTKEVEFGIRGRFG
jgi:hypothetical protein